MTSTHTFQDAFDTLLKNRLFRGISVKQFSWGLAIFALVGLIFSDVFDVLVGVVLALGLITMSYMVWYRLFMYRNAQRGVRCPKCLERSWQFSCAFCGKEVPPLNYWLRGLFSPDCPHCGQHISSQKGTLLAMCSSPSRHEAQWPHRLYNKECQMIVWVVEDNHRPLIKGKGWSRVGAPGEHGEMYFYENDFSPEDRESSCFLLIFSIEDLRKRKTRELPIHSDLIEQTRLLIFSDGVEKRYSHYLSSIRGHFDDRYTVFINGEEP